ncbi:MAG: IgGFc-binding protein [Myxococcaceae bacterium]|nr:IgGFc-binding protein [Myxococcaceae bacterium]
MRSLLAAPMLVVALSCSAPPTMAVCSSTTCTGCCDLSGQCQSGFGNNACGQRGGACVTCMPTQQCTLGNCTASSGTGGGFVTGGGSAGGTAAGGSAAGGDAGGSAAGGSAGGSTAGGSAAGGDAGGSAAGGSTAGGSTAGGSTAGGSTAGGSTAGGSTAGGSTAGGSTAGGSAAGGSAAGGSAAGGSAAGGSAAGGSAAGGSAAGGSAGGGAGLSCATAALQSSSEGCEFWGVVMDNVVGDDFRGNARDGGQGTNSSEFAFLVLASPGPDATVTISRVVSGSTVQVASSVVTATTARTVLVPWQSLGTQASASGRARYAYRISATRPVSVWQFNPLATAVPTGSTVCTSNATCTLTGGDCISFGPGTRLCGQYAYTLDSSLLLPAHALGTSYVATTPEHIRSTGLTPSDFTEGQFVVIGTQNGTQVSVRTSAPTRTSGTSVADAGAVVTFTLDAYDVLQLTSVAQTATIECAANPFGGTGQICRNVSDLSGSVISASAPVAVFAGSPCALKPYSVAACDHVEEQLSPVAAWGTTYVLATGPAMRNDAGVPSPLAAAHPFKVTAACPPSVCPAGTLLTFSDPPTLARSINPNRCVSGTLRTNDCRLPQGASAEFTVATATTLTTDAPVQVVHFTPGQFATPGAVEGDPSMVVVTPVSQWTENPRFIVPDGFGLNAARLTWIGGAQVRVDGVPVTPNPVAGTQAQYALVNVMPGVHEVTTVPPNVPVGVDVHGYVSFASYSMPGGRKTQLGDAGFTP